MITASPQASEFELGPHIIFLPYDSNFLKICERSREIWSFPLGGEMWEREGAKVLILNMQLAQLD